MHGWHTQRQPNNVDTPPESKLRAKKTEAGATFPLVGTCHWALPAGSAVPLFKETHFLVVPCVPGSSSRTVPGASRISENKLVCSSQNALSLSALHEIVR
jgi:hypothetical protein